MYSFSRFSWLLFLVLLLGICRGAKAEEKMAVILEQFGLAKIDSGVRGEVLSASCGPRDESLPSHLETFRDVYIVSEEGNKQLYQSIVEWNKLEHQKWTLSPELQNRWSELEKQLQVLKDQVSSGGGMILTKTSDKGLYCSELLPGRYVIGVWNNNNGGAWVFVEVNLRAGQLQKIDLLIPLVCG